jgi:acid phosphatase type 7
LFEKYGLNAAFEHHEHAYKRTYLIRNGQVDSNGVLYLGEGAWGPERLHQVYPEGALWYVAKAASKRHFILVTLEQESRLYQAIDEEGVIFDSYLDAFSEF